MLLKQLRSALALLILMTILTGIIYPFIITGLAQLCFPEKANGSIMINKGKVIGSELIGQKFSSPKYFWSRLSATSPFPYNAAASTGSNYGPLNPALLKAVTKRIDDLKNMDSLNNEPIPVDLVTSSSSGLDPHISVAAAQYQVPRIAQSRGIEKKQIQSLIDKYTEWRTLGILGEPRINVLKINYALDEFE